LQEPRLGGRSPKQSPILGHLWKRTGPTALGVRAVRKRGSNRQNSKKNSPKTNLKCVQNTINGAAHRGELQEATNQEGFESKPCRRTTYMCSLAKDLSMADWKGVKKTRGGATTG